MGRPRLYATNAERQRAFRNRCDQTTLRVDRTALDRLHARLDRLQQALAAAAHRGDPMARRCYAASIDTLLDRLADHFQAVAAPTATQEDVWTPRRTLTGPRAPSLPTRSGLVWRPSSSSSSWR